jgi:hypothetical protein
MEIFIARKHHCREKSEAARSLGSLRNYPPPPQFLPETNGRPKIVKFCVTHSKQTVVSNSTRNKWTPRAHAPSAQIKPFAGSAVPTQAGIESEVPRGNQSAKALRSALIPDAIRYLQAATA